MASSVFYKFRHQKDPSRIAFDGTGISVFELKRDIITQNKLGEGSNFELILYNEESEVYEDDTSIIPRSTSIVARRAPARQPGKGGAARYVSGRMPVNALAGKKGSTTAKPAAAAVAGLPLANGTQSEEASLLAMFGAQKQAISARQEELLNDPSASSSMPFRRPPNKADIPDKPPPPGYVCYRCGEKGHWIQACPTNDDPNYVSQPRFKRTTGIPKSMLVKVNKEEIEEEEERPAGLMLSAEGDWVMAKSDHAAWEEYKNKVKNSKTAAQEQQMGSRELQDKGLECPLDKRMFIEPMKTPCCGKTYCSECINNALTDNDLHCPNCKSDLLFDDLSPDEEKRTAIRAYEAERAEKAKETAHAAGKVQVKSREGTPQPPTKKEEIKASVEPAERGASLSPESKKRKAEDGLDSNRAGSRPSPTAPKGPSTEKQQQEQQAQQQQQQQTQQQQNQMQGFMLNGQGMMWPMQGMPMGGQWPMNMPMMPGMEGMNFQQLQNMQWQQDGNWQQNNQGGVPGAGPANRQGRGGVNQGARGRRR